MRLGHVRDSFQPAREKLVECEVNDSAIVRGFGAAQIDKLRGVADPAKVVGIFLLKPIQKSGRWAVFDQNLIDVMVRACEKVIRPVALNNFFHMPDLSPYIA
jgi:hypothetical protein